MSQSRRIHLTAILPAENMANGQPDMNGILYTMEAELASALLRTNPDGSTEETAGGVPSIHYSPGTRLPKSEPPLSGSLPGLVVSTPRSHSEATRDVIAWKLDWISKGGTME